MGIVASQVSAAEQVSGFRTALHRADHEIMRAHARLQTQETKLKQEIRRRSPSNMMESQIIFLRELVHIRVVMHNYHTLSSKLRAIGLRIETVRAQTDGMERLRETTEVMHQFTQMTNIFELQATMQRFMRENDMMDLMSEMLDDSIVTANGAEEPMDQETAILYARLLEELGLPIPPELADRARGGDGQPPF
jgi:division protein CdvB (Snf7/Vps24/ESCRT-III family)